MNAPWLQRFDAGSRATKREQPGRMSGPPRRFRAGDEMSVSVSMTPGSGSPRVDAYLVLQLPNGQLLSLTPRGFVPGLAPLARNVPPVRFRAVIARLHVPAGIPPGTYRWLSAHTAAGTLNLVSEISERRFTIAP